MLGGVKVREVCINIILLFLVVLENFDRFRYDVIIMLMMSFCVVRFGRFVWIVWILCYDMMYMEFFLLVLISLFWLMGFYFLYL